MVKLLLCATFYKHYDLRLLYQLGKHFNQRSFADNYSKRNVVDEYNKLMK